MPESLGIAVEQYFLTGGSRAVHSAISEIDNSDGNRTILEKSDEIAKRTLDCLRSKRVHDSDTQKQVVYDYSSDDTDSESADAAIIISDGSRWENCLEAFERCLNLIGDLQPSCGVIEPPYLEVLLKYFKRIFVGGLASRHSYIDVLCRYGNLSTQQKREILESIVEGMTKALEFEFFHPPYIHNGLCWIRKLMSGEKYPRMLLLLDKFDRLVDVEEKKEALDTLRQLKGLVGSMEVVDFQSLEPTEPPLITRLRLMKDERKKRLHRRHQRQQRREAEGKGRKFRATDC